MICAELRIVDERRRIGHAACMAIRIREWGLLRNAAQQVQVPLHGLTDWERSAEQTGQGLAAMVLSGNRMIQEKHEVEAAGELAAFSETLRMIEQETREELHEHPADDWEYAWQAASAPRVAAAIAELPPALRESARNMATAYTQEAGIRAWRDKELEGIERARTQWQSRVDNAVQAGDDEQARKWLEQGRGIFVPEARMPEVEKTVVSRAGLNQWCKKLQQAPLQTLGDYLHVPRSARKWRPEEENALKQEIDKAQKQAKIQLADTLQMRLVQGIQTEPAELKQAVRAGLISPAQYDAALSSPREVTSRQYNCWLRRVAEHDATPDAQSAFKLDVCMSPLPDSRRLELLERVDQAASLRREDRLSLSNKLWNLYHSGAFGCPGDEWAEKRLMHLQISGLPMLATEGNEAVAQWLESLDRRDEQWICFSPHNA